MWVSAVVSVRTYCAGMATKRSAATSARTVVRLEAAAARLGVDDAASVRAWFPHAVTDDLVVLDMCIDNDADVNVFTGCSVVRTVH